MARDQNEGAPRPGGPGGTNGMLSLKDLESAVGDGTTRLWDVRSGRQTAVLAGHTDYVMGVAVTADGELGLNHLCAGYLHFFTHVDGLMHVMADAIRRGGYADEVMGVLAAAGRNDPCPCGSGRKTKHCHG